jgi:hypothetical protein
MQNRAAVEWQAALAQRVRLPPSSLQLPRLVRLAI